MDTPNSQIHNRSLFWLGTGSSIKCGRVKLVLWAKTWPLRPSELTNGLSPMMWMTAHSRAWFMFDAHIRVRKLPVNYLTFMDVVISPFPLLNMVTPITWELKAHYAQQPMHLSIALNKGCMVFNATTIFQLCRGGQFYLWRIPEYPEKTTDLS